MKANTYSPEKCNGRLRELYVCCKEMYESAKAGGKEAESTACPIPEVVDRWLKNHSRHGDVEVGKSS